MSVTTSASPRRIDAEEVAVGHQAQPLVPRVVGRLEVQVDRIALGQLLDGLVADEPLARGRGQRRLAWKLTVATAMLFQRLSQYDARAGRNRRSTRATGSTAGTETT